MRHAVSRAAGAGAVAAYLTLQWFGRTWGTSRQERRRQLPGDRLTHHWTWAFVLDDLGDDKTRFIEHSRLRAGPWWVAAAYLLAIIPAGFVMSRQMLRGVKTRVKRGGRVNPGQDGRMPRRQSDMAHRRPERRTAFPHVAEEY